MDLKTLDFLVFSCDSVANLSEGCVWAQSSSLFEIGSSGWKTFVISRNCFERKLQSLRSLDVATVKAQIDLEPRIKVWFQ